MRRSLTVCVEYDDLLALTLPGNSRHFDECWVITAPKDSLTPPVVARLGDKGKLFVTDAFYRHGAVFNKGLAVEECLDAMGRTGTMAIIDADTALPVTIPWAEMQKNKLYVPRRRMLTDVTLWRSDMDWQDFPLNPEAEFPGYCQIFQAEDPKLVCRRPWYGVNWRHAGGCDSDFQMIWEGADRVRPRFEVLHLGPDGHNWCGRRSERLDGFDLLDAETRARRARDMHLLNTDREFRYGKLDVTGAST